MAQPVPSGEPSSASPLVDDVPDHVITETAPEVAPASDVLEVELGDLPADAADIATDAATFSGGPPGPTRGAPRRKRKPTPPRGEKAPALDPVLLLGAAEELQALAREEAGKSVTIEGLLKIEEHPVTRRAAVRRWVLETASGTRIPLRSSLAFITELKKDGIFDQPVRLTGVWRPTPGNERLRFFAADRIEPRPEGGDGAIASGAAGASGTARLSTTATATAFLAYEDELASGDVRLAVGSGAAALPAGDLPRPGQPPKTDSARVPVGLVASPAARAAASLSGSPVASVSGDVSDSPVSSFPRSAVASFSGGAVASFSGGAVASFSGGAVASFSGGAVASASAGAP